MSRETLLYHSTTSGSTNYRRSPVITNSIVTNRCSYSALRKFRLVNHYAKVHGIRAKQILFKCVMCSSTAESRLVMKNHYKTHKESPIARVQRDPRLSHKRVAPLIQSRIITEKAINANLKRSLNRKIYEHLCNVCSNWQESRERAIDVHKKNGQTSNHPSNHSWQLIKRTRESVLIKPPTTRVKNARHNAVINTIIVAIIKSLRCPLKYKLDALRNFNDGWLNIPVTPTLEIRKESEIRNRKKTYRYFTFVKFFSYHTPETRKVGSEETTCISSSIKFKSILAFTPRYHSSLVRVQVIYKE